jgi:hypothetical protein
MPSKRPPASGATVHAMTDPDFDDGDEDDAYCEGDISLDAVDWDAVAIIEQKASGVADKDTARAFYVELHGGQ